MCIEGNAKTDHHAEILVVESIVYSQADIHRCSI